jgi:hypothetical protein
MQTASSWSFVASVAALTESAALQPGDFCGRGADCYARRCGCCPTCCGWYGASPPTPAFRAESGSGWGCCRHLATPIDLIPDFIPVLGYADDAVVVTAVLRSVVRRAGIDAVRAHWPGTDDGFAALCRLTGLNPSAG